MPCKDNFFDDNVCIQDKLEPGLQKRFDQENPLLYCPLSWRT